MKIKKNLQNTKSFLFVGIKLKWTLERWLA